MTVVSIRFKDLLRNQVGEVVVAEGAILEDSVLLSMDYYVEDVQGSLPK